MKKKIVKISLLSVFVIILTVLGIFNLLNNISSATEKTTAEGYEVSKPKIIVGDAPDEHDYSKYLWEKNWTTKKLREGLIPSRTNRSNLLYTT